jgi:pyruvate dehydrogenase E2 component (dihydrolipoamide acetyltransferase)
MDYEIKMPSLGADMDQAKLLKWKVRQGDIVTKGQTLAEIETTKAAVEMESYKTGVITKLIAHEGDMIPVGQVMAQLDFRDEKIEKTPLQKLEPVDVPAQEASISILKIREAIALAMTTSKKEIPHYYLKSKIFVDDLIHWMDLQNSQRSVEKRILLPSLFIKALSVALQKNPDLNGFFIDNHFQTRSEIHINMALALKGGGVSVPALLDTHQKNLDQINEELKDLIERARSFKLKQRELTEGTFTLSFLGDLGVEEVFGIIFPPQVGILGIGSLHEEVVAKNKNIKIEKVINVILSGDHRASDGLCGAKFLKDFEKEIRGFYESKNNV